MFSGVGLEEMPRARVPCSNRVSVSSIDLQQKIQVTLLSTAQRSCRTHVPHVPTTPYALLQRHLRQLNRPALHPPPPHDAPPHPMMPRPASLCPTAPPALPCAAPPAAPAHAVMVAADRSVVCTPCAAATFCLSTSKEPR